MRNSQVNTVATPDSRTRRRLQQPPMYNLVMLNDDFTPMDFVIKVLRRLIHMNNHRAMLTMLQIHHKGQAECGVYTKEIGETKIKQIHHYAKEHSYPLRCLLRKTKD